MPQSICYFVGNLAGFFGSYFLRKNGNVTIFDIYKESNILAARLLEVLGGILYSEVSKNCLMRFGVYIDEISLKYWKMLIF